MHSSISVSHTAVFPTAWTAGTSTSSFCCTDSATLTPTSRLLEPSCSCRRRRSWQSGRRFRCWTWGSLGLMFSRQPATCASTHPTPSQACGRRRRPCCRCCSACSSGACAALLPLLHLCNNTYRHGYALRNVFMLGFSQGGTVALSVVQSLKGAPIGGAVSICGAPLPLLPSATCSSTPILFTLGERDTAAASKTRAWSQFETQWRSAAASQQQQSLAGSQLDCCMVVVAGKAEAMTQSEGETRVLMQFFGRHLNLRSLQLCVGHPAAAHGCRVTRLAGMRSRTLSAWMTRTRPRR